MFTLLKFVAALTGCALLGVAVGAGIVAFSGRCFSLSSAILGGMAVLYCGFTFAEGLSGLLLDDAYPPSDYADEVGKRE